MRRLIFLMVCLFINLTLFSRKPEPDIKRKKYGIEYKDSSIILIIKDAGHNALYEIPKGKFIRIINQIDTIKQDSIVFLVRYKNEEYISRKIGSNRLHNFIVPYVVLINNYTEFSNKMDNSEFDYITYYSKKYHPVSQVIPVGNKLSESVLILYIPYKWAAFFSEHWFL